MTTTGRRFLVAVDASEYSERAFEWFIENVFRKDDYVIVFHCQEPPPSANPMFPNSANSDELAKEKEEHKEKMNQLVDMYKAKCESYKIKAKIKVESGKSAGETICKIAKADDVQSIVIGCRGMSALKRALIGGVSDYVVHHSHVPVILVPAEGAINKKL